ncbi:MAG: energy-coupling factor transporter ATPase [Lachnospiraceae bacterium]|nr:energy-coupling factor transporter ATPase [Lachnospiraceae bacterium]
MDHAAEIINISHVTHSYVMRDEQGNIEEETIALDDVSLAIKEGEFLAVLGSNGSGKSTLARHLNALLLPDDGSVLVDGMDTGDNEKIIEIRRRAGMVFQNPDNQIIGRVVEEDVAFGPENLGLPPEKIRQRVDEALTKLGMQKKRAYSPGKLSGGQKQRVSIAGILAMRPKILILDEPTAMLDPRGRREVLSAAMSLNKDEGITVILITHDMDEAAMADRIVVMDKGRVAMEGTPSEVFRESDKLRAYGLDIPFPAQIAAELKEMGLDIGTVPVTTEELAEALGLKKQSKQSTNTAEHIAEQPV